MCRASALPLVALLLQPLVASAAAAAASAPIGECVTIDRPSDDIHNNTARIQGALDAAPAVPGGGCVRVTGGDFVIAGVSVKSNTTFRIEDDARLVARINVTTTAVVQVADANHVTLEGGGTIHGSAEDAWIYFSREDDRMQPFAAEGPTRPNVLLLSRSRDVVVRGLRLHNSSDWTFRLDDCHDVYVDGVDIYGDERFPNNDGFDPESCTNVTLVNSHIDVADDGICPKAGPAGPLRGLIVRNTTVRSRSGAIKFGSNTDSPMENILFDNLTIHDSNGGLKIQQRTGGSIRNVTWSNIVLETRYQAPRWWGNGEWLGLSNSPRDDGSSVGTMSGLRFINISGRAENGGLVSGLTGSSASGGSPFGATDVLFQNVHILISAWSNYSLQDADGVIPLCSADPVICSNETLPHCTSPDWAARPGSPLRCAGTRDYRPHDGGNCAHGCRTPSKAHGIHLENVAGVRFDNVTFEFAAPRRPWYGACFSVDSLSRNITGAADIHCINGPSVDAHSPPP